MRPIDADNLTARLRNSYKRRESALRMIGISDEAKGIIDSLIDVIDEELTVALVKHGHWIFYKDMGENILDAQIAVRRVDMTMRLTGFGAITANIAEQKWTR